MTNDDQTNQDATSPTNSEAVRSGDWLGEWEAALSHLQNALRKTPLDELSGDEWSDSSVALTRLTRIVNARRRHSPSVPVSDSFGSRA